MCGKILHGRPRMLTRDLFAVDNLDFISLLPRPLNVFPVRNVYMHTLSPSAFFTRATLDPCAVCAVVRCLSVCMTYSCPSHAAIVSKRLNLS